MQDEKEVNSDKTKISDNSKERSDVYQTKNVNNVKKNKKANRSKI